MQNALTRTVREPQRRQCSSARKPAAMTSNRRLSCFWPRAATSGVALLLRIIGHGLALVFYFFCLFSVVQPDRFFSLTRKGGPPRDSQGLGGNGVADPIPLRARLLVRLSLVRSAISSRSKTSLLFRRACLHDAAWTDVHRLAAAALL